MALRFVVMGDTHYVRPESHREAFAGRPKGVTELADLQRNLWMTRHVLPRVVANIASLQPDLVIQTGDIIQGHGDSEPDNVHEMGEALDLLQGLRSPLFFALGTHDGVLGRREEAAIRQLVLPHLSRTLGEPLHRTYYTFQRDGALFVVLDYATFAPDDPQAAFISETLARADHYDHVFLLAHPPLIPVGRPFFSSLPFARAVLAALSRHPVDAYFCGHTHNQIATLHRVGPDWLPHLKSTVLGFPDQPPLPLTDVRPLLPDPATFDYGWGFLEDSAPSWWLVTVDGDAVTAEWHVLDRGVEGRLTWRRGEKAIFQQRPEAVTTRRAGLPPREAIRSVRLRAAGSGCRQEGAYQVRLNGQPLGALPRLEYFDARQFLPVPEPLWPALREENQLEVTTGEEPMCIGGFVLEVETAEGWWRSTVSPFYANVTRWDAWAARPLAHIAPGATLKVALDFSHPAG